MPTHQLDPCPFCGNADQRSLRIQTPVCDDGFEMHTRKLDDAETLGDVVQFLVGRQIAALESKGIVVEQAEVQQ